MRVIGKHKLTNFSVENSGVEKMFEGEPKVGALYVDPPWGDGNMKYWVTLRGKHVPNAEEVKPLKYSELINRILYLNKTYCRGPLVIETGPQWNEQVEARMKKDGLVGVRSVPHLYRSGSRLLPSFYVVGSTAGSPIITHTPPERQSGPSAVADMVRGVVSEGDILLDPCCGMGNSARAAVKLGLRFFGNEFNLKRLTKTINFLEKNP